MAVTKEQLETKMQSLSVDRASRAKAIRALEGYHLETSESNIRKYVALQALLPAKSRITPKLMSSFNKEVKQSTAAGQKFHMQWKAKLPVPPASAVGKLVDPQSIPDFPAGIDVNDVWLFEWNAPTDELGSGLMFCRTECATTRRLDMSAAAAGGEFLDAPLAPSPSTSIGEQSPASFPATSAPTCIASRDQQPPRALVRGDSDTTTEAAFETIAIHAKRCADKLLLVSDDKSDPDSLGSWVRQFQADLARNPREPRPCDIKFIRFVSKTLLETASYSVLPSFASHFIILGEAYPAFKLPYLDAMIGLSKHDPLSDEPVETNLTVEQSPNFFLSTLFQDFKANQFSLRLEKLRTAHDMPQAERLAGIEKLRRKAPTEQIIELDVATTVLGKLPHLNKLEYVLKHPEHFEMLRSWAPDKTLVTEALLCQPFVGASPMFSDLTIDAYVDVAGILSKPASLLDIVQHPILKNLIAHFSSMKEAAGTSPELKKAVEIVGKTLAVARCGFAGSLGDEALPDLGALSEEETSVAKAIRGGRVARLGQEIDGAHWESVSSPFLGQGAAGEGTAGESFGKGRKGKGTGERKGSLGLGAAGAAARAGRKGRERGLKNIGEVASATASCVGESLSVGDQVVITVKVRKPDYDQMRATIKSISYHGKDITLTMDEGPCKGI
mmetsp:Transcript_60306/g.168470  ORF Transcript_60306/g.168470 Transcript_60306/m.168470 type:complete len:670 (-) Transcript_60306:221-2230(-)